MSHTPRSARARRFPPGKRIPGSRDRLRGSAANKRLDGGGAGRGGGDGAAGGGAREMGTVTNGMKISDKSFA